MTFRYDPVSPLGGVTPAAPPYPGTYPNIVDGIKPALESFYAALANRNNATVNVGIMGASLAEGYPVALYRNTIGQLLAKILRARHPIEGSPAGGRGYIGIPSDAAVSTGWPIVFTGGAFFDSPFYFGAKHRSWVGSSAGHKAVLTLTAPVTAFDIKTVTGSSGNANGAYYKIDNNAAVFLNTFSAATALQTIRVNSPATSTIEVGWLANGALIFDGIVEYAGDETKGIQVHNLGQASYSAAQWLADASDRAAGWRASINALGLDLLILQDFGVNDGYTANGNKQASAFKSDMAALIKDLRNGGISCPIVLASVYNTAPTITFASKSWQPYADALSDIAASDPTIFYVDYSTRMPGVGESDTYGLYAGDLLHGNANGAAYQMIAEILAHAIAPA